MPDTILLTGVTGFIAKHVALTLLRSGYTVRGTFRNPDRATGVRDALRPHLEADAMDRLTFAQADLDHNDGWTDAMQGIGVVVHTASPFPIAQPKNEGDLIRPAVDGTRRVLGAARDAGIGRVVLTSSTVAVMNGRRGLLTEDDWLDPATPGTTAYAKSKVLAERAAWDFVTGTGIAMTAINPGLVAGPPLDDRFCSSLGVIQRFLKGRDPMVPRIGFPIVDVRDVAEMHLRAIQRPETAGKRYLAVAGSMWMADICRVLKTAYPDRRIPVREAPNLLIHALALIDRDLKSIVPSLGVMETASNARALAEMDMTFITPEESILASARYLVDRKLI